MCFNKKILVTLGVIAVAVFVLKPSLLVAALPLLILAVCPLSMIFMMKGMNGMNTDQTKAPVDASSAEPDSVTMNKAAHTTGKATFADRFDALWPHQLKTDPSTDFTSAPGEPTGHGSGTWRDDRP